MIKKPDISLVLQRIAGTAISPSAAQNQGPPGTMLAAVRFCFKPGLLEDFASVESPDVFNAMLNAQTDKLRHALPTIQSDKGRTRGGNWGSARKFLNIFLFECTLNKHLCAHFRNLDSIEPWLEVPLDGFVGRGLALETINQNDPNPLFWDTIIGLNRDTSDRFQLLASKVADHMGLLRVHLDFHYLQYPAKEAD